LDFHYWNLRGLTFQSNWRVLHHFVVVVVVVVPAFVGEMEVEELIIQGRKLAS
jgi:hypothetical protein